MSHHPSRIVRSGLLTVLLLMAANAHAETIKVKPGKWQVESTSSNPFTGDRKYSNTQCIEKEEFDPAKEMAKSAECKLLSHDIKGNTMNWTMSCNTEGVVMTAKGHFQSKGDTASGEMTMNADMGGQPFTMKMTWNGKRIGDCN
ncbi:MAG: DUF3617 family protein [Pseudomonadota bacterium]|nr:DUF3617 family protein [Pseudomonadota bacterium]